MNTGDDAGQGYNPPPEGGQAQMPQPTTPLPNYPPPASAPTGQTYYDPGATARVNTGGYGQYTGTGQVPPQGQPVPPQQPYTYYDSRAARAAARAADRANRQHRVPIVGPLLLITAGVIFLLNNVGILDWSVWDSIWRLWPLVLVIIGIDMLVGRRSPVLSLLLVIVIIAAGAAFFYSVGGFAGSGTREQYSLNVPLDGAKTANIHVDIGTGQLSIDGDGAGSALASGTLDYYTKWGAPSPSTDTSGDTVTLRLKQPNNNGPFFFGGPNGAVNWNIHLNPSAAISLDANTGTGRADLDLRGLHVTNLSLNSGTGATSVIFPAQAGATTASVDGGVGAINIAIPEGVEARIRVDSGLGGVNVDPRFPKSGDKTYESSGYSSAKNKLDLEVNAGVGSVDITSR